MQEVATLENLELIDLTVLVPQITELKWSYIAID